MARTVIVPERFRYLRIKAAIAKDQLDAIRRPNGDDATMIAMGLVRFNTYLFWTEHLLPIENMLSPQLHFSNLIPTDSVISSDLPEGNIIPFPMSDTWA